MKIALLGYGKMGKAIESIALERGHEIGLKVDESNANYSASALQGHDVAIEFSRPETATANIGQCLAAQVPVVVGTTGWYHEFETIAEQVQQKQGSLFYATNFSVGVNLFFQINQRLAELMNDWSEYAVHMEEIHHVHKLDSPSGTAITLAEQITHRLDRKNAWSEGREATDHEINITSKREAEVPGTHSIQYRSGIDQITITHEAFNRKGFATGSVLAAEWILGKTGIFTMNDLLDLRQRTND